MAPRPRRFEAKREEWIRLRVTTGRSLQAVADEVGVTATHLGYIEAGERQPSPALSARVAALYGVTVESLLTFITEEDAA